MNVRIPQSPPVVLPLTENERPFWSVMIPAYNCIAFLERTLRSVLAQDRGAANMQIEVVDDCSTDGNVEELVRNVGGGRIAYYRQPENKGSLRNFETCLNRSRGYWVHLLHGDDLVKPGFYTEMESLINNHPDIGSAISCFSSIDEADNESAPVNSSLRSEPGILHDWLYTIASFQRVQPPSVVVKRAVYEHLGSFYGVEYGEDWEMWVRIAAHYPVAFSPKCLALYRSRKANISSASIRSGRNFKDVLWVIDTVQKYLPPERRREMKNKALRNFSVSYARSAYRIYKGKEERPFSFILAKQSLKMHRNIRNLYWLGRLLALHVASRLRFGRRPKAG